MAATKPENTRPGGRRRGLDGDDCIRGLLTAATCSLLAPGAQAESYDNDWVSDVSYSGYKEADDRISVNKLIAFVSGKLNDTNRINLDLVVDSMTGATPTGGLPASGGLVSVTGTSGGGFSTGGEPLALAPFDDTRLAFNAEWDHDFSRTLRLTSGGSVSVENDYNSYGSAFKLEKDTADKLTTFSTGLAFASDRISQLSGDTPDPLSDVSDQRFFDEGERTTIDWIAGFSRVLNARAVMQLNLSLSDSRGYHTDPYKVISVANEDDVELERRYESRPRSRERKSLYYKNVFYLNGGDNLHVAYRYYTDDWEIESHTIDTRYRFNFGNGSYVEPHVRLYSQSEADFYVRTLAVGDPPPEYASADNRLAEMTSYTAGVKYGFPLMENGEMRLRAEYIDQTFENAIIDTNQAVLVQVSFRKAFK